MSTTEDAPTRSSKRKWLVILGANVLLIGGWIAYDTSQARAIWPAEMPTLEMPPPVITPHPDSLGRLDALIDASADLEQTHDARKAIVSAEGPPTIPPEGWPPDDEAAQAALDAFLATGGLALGPIVIEAAPSRSFLPLMHASTLRLARAIRRFAEGDPAAGWRDVVDTWTTGHRLAHSGAHLLATMVGMSIEDQALSTALRMVDAGPWHAEGGALARALDEAAGRPSALVAALTGECLAADGLYARMGEADVESLEETGNTGQLEPAGPDQTRADDTWLYDSHKTRAYARQHCLGTIEAARTPAPQRQPPPTLNLGERKWYSVGPMLDNPVGRTLLAIAQPDFSRYIERADRLTYRRRRVRLALARAAFTASAGRAPTAVSDLVPTHLPDALVDPLTGQPMPLDPPPAPELD